MADHERGSVGAHIEHGRRDLLRLAQATGQASGGPAKLIVPMLIQFMATDRGFAKARRQLGTCGKKPV